MFLRPLTSLCWAASHFNDKEYFHLSVDVCSMEQVGRGVCQTLSWATGGNQTLFFLAQTFLRQKRSCVPCFFGIS